MSTTTHPVVLVPVERESTPGPAPLPGRRRSMLGGVLVTLVLLVVTVAVVVLSLLFALFTLVVGGIAAMVGRRRAGRR